MSQKLFGFSFWLLFVLGLNTSSNLLAQTNEFCSQMQPICTDQYLERPLQNITVSELGVNYGCLMPTYIQPNWYYFQIDNSGDLYLEIEAPYDIDFIIYGPFADLSAAQSHCGDMGVSPDAPIVDCGVTSSSIEYPEILNVTAGQVYVLIVNNYAGAIQNFTFKYAGGLGSTSCDSNYVCVADVGTYKVYKNGYFTTSSPVILYGNQQLKLVSNGDYTLPTEIIPQPIGDGVYSAQLVWLVYDGPPTVTNPLTDPNFTNVFFLDDTVIDYNNSTSPIIQNWGCGDTYWFVPVTIDDGVGGNNNIDNNINDNGAIKIDRNLNNCFVTGNPVMVTYDCLLGDFAQATDMISIFYFGGSIWVTNLHEANATINIYDMEGRLVKSAFAQEGENSFLEQLNQGVYICEFISTEGFRRFKFNKIY